MYKKNLIKKYGDAQETVGKSTQIIMLYDGMIKFMKIAKEALQKGDFNERYNYTEKAAKIITGLQASLDFNVGKKVAATLDAYYGEIFIKMMQFNIQNDVEICNEVIRDLEQMRNTWKEISENEPASKIDLEEKGFDDSNSGSGTSFSV